MPMRGLFLGSRVARRIYWVLLAASLLPLAVFGGLGWQAYVEYDQAQQRRASTEYLKHIGLRAYDRLNAARATLAAHAAEGDRRRPALEDPAVQALLSSAATLHDDGTVAGDPALVAAWDARAVRRGLWWQPATAERPARVLLVHRDAHVPAWWLAEVNPAFLWADFAADGPAAALCVQDGSGDPLRCPAPPRLGAPAWRLFMHAGFASPDWVISGEPPSMAAAGDWPLGRLLGLGSVATLLLIAVLALVMVRRTMVPLEQLLAGTHRLAGGDWQARVATGRNDEFGQLADAFNRMAGRIGRQVQALEVQSAIDREILGGLDVARVMAHVAARLQALSPQARVAVLARDPAGAGWQVHRPAGPAADAAVPDREADAPAADGLAVHCGPGRRPPAWATQALGPAGPPGALSWVPVRWQDELVALLLLGSEAPLALDDEGRREVEDLRDRAAVTLAAAQRERRLVERAVRDELTGLLNRHGLHDACDALLPQPAGLLFVDLDGFKEVNDAMGHTAGDELLRAVADRLRDAAPASARLARPGGDEFVVLVPGEAEAAERLAGALCTLLAQPFMLRGQLIHIGASIGLAQAPADGTERDVLMRRADLAMYAAKGEGRGRWRRYAEAMDHEASERAWIVRDLRAALDAGTLTLHFQPRVELRTGLVPSTEALVRWPHPERGWIPPIRFIPVAEESDLIVRLGDFVLDAALAQQRRWRDDGVAVGRVAVNVSARQLRDPAFADKTLALLRRHGLRPQDLELELTESLFAGESAAVARALEPLRRRGVLVALDDFGTGYSSLSALQHLPIDVLKIDRSFVIELGERDAGEAVVRSIMALARALGKRVVAEGVETRVQEQRLLALGCDEFQGYRYARPLPAEEFAPRLRQGFAPAADPLPEPVAG